MGDNLFSPKWTTGKLDDIEFVVEILATVATWVISVVGFGIIISSLLKNSVAALYCANSNFWDKVDQIKQGQKVEIASGANSNQATAVLGSAITLFLSFMPNIKKMTDFDDGVLDAKMYFMKAIPMMMLTIFIGVFVFRGYPARIAEFSTNLGTGVLDAVLTNVDPIAWVEKIPTEIAVIRLTTDAANDDVSKNINKVSKKVISAYLGAVNDIPKKERVNVARDIEAWVSTKSGEYQSYCDTGKYKCDVTALIQRFDPQEDINRIHGVESNGVTQFSYAESVSYFDKGVSALDTSNMWVQYIVKFTRVASKTTKKEIQCTLTLPNGDEYRRIGENGTAIIVSMPTPTGSYGFYGWSSPVGKDESGNYVYVYVSSGGKLKIVQKEAKNSLEGVRSITNIDGLFYQSGTSRHEIKNIYFGDNSSPVFTDVNGNVSPWSWGEEPKVGNTASEDSGSDSSPTNVISTGDDGL